ncbi:hypothetical protein FH972_001591 [Carpinus fangiana]|uniref:Uncharacterized protein n=1 Tax=Carpinus fangiana TaxID=176857 RepID=A0A5N6QFE5_9ROSI|nr:hypothetical protein FH972_001591 [Carpinus fangiana]
MAIEEFTGNGRRGFILIPDGKKKWGWCGVVEVLQYLFSIYLHEMHTSGHWFTPIESHSVLVNRSFAQVVVGQGGQTTSNDRVADGASVMAH